MFAFRSRRTASVALLVSFSLGWTSCQGPAGPDGKDAPYLDTVSPEVRLISPIANARVFTDTLTLQADFPDGGDDVVRLEFLVNGSSDLGYDSMVVYPPATSCTVDLHAAGIAYGTVLLGAVASDGEGNVGQSGFRLINYLVPGQPFRLEAWRVRGTGATLRVPETTTYVKSTDIVALDVYSLAFRFPVPFNATLDSVEINLTQSLNPLPLGPLYLTLHPVVADSPGVALDTFTFEPDFFDLNHPLALDLSSWRGDSTAWLLAQDYFIALGAPDSLSRDPRGIDFRMTTRVAEHPQPEWGELWIGSRDAQGVEHWHRSVSLDTTTFFYPQMTVILGQVDEP
ncbi:MAG: Ig-like domain-containing protein [bacterium]